MVRTDGITHDLDRRPVSLGHWRCSGQAGCERTRHGSTMLCRLFRAGHVPIVGEWLALPLVDLAGSTHIGDAAFDEIFHPIAERLLARCDAVLRIGGASQGADQMVESARERGLRVFTRLQEIPGCAGVAEPVG